MEIEQLLIAILDTNVFINSPSELINLTSSYQLVTTSSVTKELKDSKSRTTMEFLKNFIKIQESSEKSKSDILEFAKKTGDCISISTTDLDLLALTLDLTIKIEGIINLKESPSIPINHKSDNQGWSNEESDWISPSNNKNNLNISLPKVSLLTSDYAMQNLALQKGLHLISLDGNIINRIKNYVLECFSCWTISRNNDQIFCKRCGQPTLLKITSEIDENGTMTLYRKKNKIFRIKGNKYAVPNPKGGREIGFIFNEAKSSKSIKKN